MIKYKGTHSIIEISGDHVLQLRLYPNDALGWNIKQIGKSTVCYCKLNIYASRLKNRIYTVAICQYHFGCMSLDLHVMSYCMHITGIMLSYSKTCFRFCNKIYLVGFSTA